MMQFGGHMMFERCICGSTTVHNSTIRKGCRVDATGNEQAVDITTVQCKECGVVRQINLPFHSEKEFTEYYKKKYPPVKKAYTIKNYKHDRAVAAKRYSAYGIPELVRILDVGSGSGAFVDECRSRGVEAYGCEIGAYHYQENGGKYIYKKQFEDINFPTDHFDVVTCHDVLEHVLDPLMMLKELFRVTAQEGECIIDFPRFYHEAGKHHWKGIEHIWYLTTEQLEDLAVSVGFDVEETNHPIESKTVFHLTKPVQNRVSILLPPGIGDVYWEIVKLRAFLKREKLGIPDMYIASRKNRWSKSHSRAFPYIEMFPFLNSTGEVLGMGKGDVVWDEAYRKVGRTVFEDVLGCDYFLSHNGHLTAGMSLLKSDPDLECEWFPPMFISLEQDEFRKQIKKQCGKYIVFYYTFEGTNKYLLKQIPFENFVKITNTIIAKTGCTPIFVGAEWDTHSSLLNRMLNRIPNHINLIGQTTLPQLFGLIRGAEMVFGIPSGVTILSTALKCKTIILWGDYFHVDFAINTCPPSTVGKTYLPVYGKQYSGPAPLVKMAVDLIGGKKIQLLPKPFPVARVNHKAKNESITVVCLLRSGGDYTVDYVRRLKNMVARNTTVPHQFLCLTDIDIAPEICNSRKIKMGYPGWWSKVELFRKGLIETKRAVYFDLDTVIVANIDNILRMGEDFVALQPWNPTNRQLGMCASGLLSWNNNGGAGYSFIFDEFDITQIGKYPRGDQEYISQALANHGKGFQPWQQLVSGIYSYKRNCHGKNLPGNARVICFHGRPRPTEVSHLNWVKENWK